MQVGDLVWLNSNHFDIYDDHIGIILELIITPDGKLVKIAWIDNGVSWFHEEELEVISESR